MIIRQDWIKIDLSDDMTRDLHLGNTKLDEKYKYRVKIGNLTNAYITLMIKNSNLNDIVRVMVYYLKFHIINLIYA